MNSFILNEKIFSLKIVSKWIVKKKKLFFNLTFIINLQNNPAITFTSVKNILLRVITYFFEIV